MGQAAFRTPSVALIRKVKIMQGTDALTQLISVVLDLGLPGVIIISLAWVIKALHTDNKELRQQVFDIGIKNAQALEASTSALTRLTDNLVREPRT